MKILYLNIQCMDDDQFLTNTDLDNTSFLSFDPAKYMLSKINLKWLDKILDESDAKIVISSNWRKFIPPYIQWEYEGKRYSSILEPFKDLYKGCIIDMLPPIRYATKSECLELWFEDNAWFSKQHSKYVILEDDTREKYQEHPIFCKHLVLTNYHIGLSENDANKAIDILNK